MSEVHGVAAKVEFSSDGVTWIDLTGAVGDFAADVTLDESPFVAPAWRPRRRCFSCTVRVRFLTLREVYYRYRAYAVGWPRHN